MLWIALDGAVNVRDLGGLPTGDGSVTAPKRLLRADNLQELSAADISRLVQEFGLTRVIDLRSIAEVQSEGPGPLTAVSSVDHVHHSVIPRDRDLAEVEHQSVDHSGTESPLNPTGEVPPVVSGSSTAADVVSEVLLVDQEARTRAELDAAVAQHYLGYLQERPDSVVAALRAIADTPGSALVHCAAGKDRTGVVVALALLAVGVNRSAVVADYAATADRIQAILARLRGRVTYAEKVNRISDEQHTPRASGMELFLELIDQQYGGVDLWLVENGFGAADRQRLRHKLLGL